MTYFTKLNPAEMISLFSGLYKSKPELLHVRHPPHLQLVGVFLRKLLGIPLVIEVHRLLSKTDYELGLLTGIQYRYYYALEKAILGSVDCVVTISDTNKAGLVAEGVDSKKIVVVPNGVDTKAFNPDKQSSKFHKKYDAENLLLYCGGMRDTEGLETLIRALPSIKESMPKTRLLMVSKGYVKAKLDKIARELDVLDMIDYLGFISDKEHQDLMASVDLFMYPRKGIAYHTNFVGVKFLEAIASGTPVVTADFGILADVVRKGDCGILFKPDDAESLALKTSELLQKSKRLTKLRKNARKTSLDYSWKNACKPLYSKYKELIQAAKK